MRELQSIDIKANFNFLIYLFAGACAPAINGVRRCYIRYDTNRVIQSFALYYL